MPLTDIVFLWLCHDQALNVQLVSYTFPLVHSDGGPSGRTSFDRKPAIVIYARLKYNIDMI